MDATSPALPNEWIPRLFRRLRSVYGSRMDQMWGQADPEDLMTAWGDELAGFEGADIREALVLTGEQHPDFPPTLPQFVGLCRAARSRRVRTVPRLQAPHQAVAPGFIEQLAAGIGKPQRNPRKWARDILEAESNGEYMPMISKVYAREALGMAPGSLAKTDLEAQLERDAIQGEAGCQL